MGKTYNTIGTFTAGQVLTAAEMNDLGENSNGYRVPPMCIVERAGQTSMANASFFAFNSAALIDTEAPSDPMHSSSVNNTRVTIQTGGVYWVCANVIYGTAPSNYPSTRLAKANIFLNGASVATAQGIPDDTYVPTISVSGLFSCAEGDYFEVRVNHSYSSNPTCTGRLQVAWLGQAS